MPITLSNTTGAGSFSLVNNTNAGSISFDLSGSVVPNPSVTPSISITPSLTPSVSRTPSVSVTPSISITPSVSITPTVTPSISVTPSVTPSASSGVTFSQTFTNGASPGTTIENAWTTFRSQLTGTYTTMTISNSLGQSITVTDANVQNIANALKTATTGTNFSVVIGANTWRVIQGCVAGTADANSIYLTNDNACGCGGAGKYTVRPMIKNANWGGINGASCNAPTQTITVTFS